MSIADTNAPLSPADEPPRLKARHVAAVTTGNALEFYDFLTYAFFAAQIGRTFFPSHTALGSLLASLATFGVGFAMRPVGAFVIGRIGDRIGRKPAMLLSMGLMGGAMVLLALVPSYASIGLAAPVLVILCRLVQGFALGGEVGPSTAYMAEAAPPGRRGLFVALQGFGQNCAVLASGLIGFGLSNALSEAQLDAFGWRIAFGIGVIIIPFGLLLRRSLPETLHETPHLTDDPPPLVKGAGLWRLAILGVFMLAGGTTVTYVLNYLTTYATVSLHMPASVGFVATIVQGVCGLIFGPASGLLSDRFGRKPVMMLPWTVLLIVTTPAFWLLTQHRSVGMLAAMTATLAVAASLATPPILAALTEVLPRNARAGGVGLIYAVAIGIFGGATQFNVAALTALTQSNLAPAWYMTGGVAVALVAMLLFPESAPHKRKTAA